ncbi:Transglycosylase SLT domain-containing protein [Glycomyces sambucus]|uniref:Transglycosylase SLT domain-containing protein n=1 Tax=Glycomyces sambucus TaxID=380244 RepID=A0A1G9M886_9ACTN|nr:lytic transglycosylase domain-containing protein [Glycomyces sambucus]SDL70449.1 Transglycosylase SLT domain-containing protein [Glycomyces sambucus]
MNPSSEPSDAGPPPDPEEVGLHPDLVSNPDPDNGTGTWLVVFVLLFASVAVAVFLFMPPTSPDGTPAAATSAEPTTESPGPEPEPTTSPEAPTTEAATTADPETTAETTGPALPTEPPSVHPPCTTYLDGGAAPASEVEAALDEAAGTQFWTNSTVEFSPDLLKAIAWMESGWQSDIVACDGGTGLMQIQPTTEKFVNQRFEADFDREDADENAMLGSAQLQWLAKYFAVNYFGGEDPGAYSLDDDCSRDDAVPDHQERCLLNSVISAYQAGFGTVEAALDAGTGYTNLQYVETVRALLELRPWEGSA